APSCDVIPPAATSPQVLRQRPLTNVRPASATTASPAKIRNPADELPVYFWAKPSDEARENPPTPPAKPTSPVITPISLRKRCGTSWNTAPLPIPSVPITTTNSVSAIGSVAGHDVSVATHSGAA